MGSITATRLARGGGEIAMARHDRVVARHLPGPGQQTALEVLAGLHRKLPPAAMREWERDARSGGWSDEIGSRAFYSTTAGATSCHSQPPGIYNRA